mmetsp:Transcript_46351/g.140395  ORF Transcript_46351/g.140395 Transcript_46351/m.140395 type:complete len:596 (-) Transcript_46351:122-1909(-)
MSWREPLWARAPPLQSKWSLDEIKGGIVVKAHILDQPCTTLGRAADAVSIPTAHESCSRVHARLAFDSSGHAWLRDLGSSNGTLVNKKRIPDKACGKIEDGCGEGSRGVVVFPGDVFTFGASTRLFCLVGPEEFSRNALAEKRVKEKAAVEQLKASESSLSKLHDNKTGEENNVSWGFDTVEGEGDDKDALDGGLSLEPLEAIPPRHQKMKEKLMSKKFKLDNIKRESERIQNKNTVSDLTEGQASQLKRNRQKEESLSNEVEELEKELRRIIAGEEMQISDSHKIRKRDTKCSWDDEDDDFYDRTRVKKRKNEPKYESETEQTLSAKWKKLVSALKQQEDDVETANKRKNYLEEKLCSIGGESDEAFFIKNDIMLAKESIEKNEEDKALTELELCGVEKMLRLVNEKLVLDRDTEFIGIKASFKKYERAQEHADAFHDMLPPTPLQGGRNPPLNSDPRPSADIMPPPKKKEFVGHSKSSRAFRTGVSSCGSVKPLAVSPSSIPGKMVPPAKRKPHGPRPPPEGTLAVMLSASNSSASVTKNDLISKRQQAASMDKKKVSSLPAQFDPRKDEWMEPSGQDGSGITKLNEKFAGRY